MNYQIYDNSDIAYFSTHGARRCECSDSKTARRMVESKICHLIIAIGNVSVHYQFTVDSRSIFNALKSLGSGILHLIPFIKFTNLSGIGISVSMIASTFSLNFAG